jgi:hypothetical protein
MLQPIWAEGGLRHGTAELHGGSHGGRVVRTLLKHSEMEGEGKERVREWGASWSGLGTPHRSEVRARHMARWRTRGAVHGDHVII